MRVQPTCLLVLAALMLAVAARSAGAADLASKPDAVVLQGGVGTHAESAAIGLSWLTGWKREFGSGTLALAVEATAGQWRTTGRLHDRSFTQLGVGPVLRFSPHAGSWFLEAGLSANGISPRYRNGAREFSTVFNFGEQLALGRRFGPHGSHELSLRIQHFSNADLKQPNPGQNFAQLRYAARF